MVRQRAVHILHKLALKLRFAIHICVDFYKNCIVLAVVASSTQNGRVSAAANVLVSYLKIKHATLLLKCASVLTLHVGIEI